ncbi:endonuclease III domain-containing protein [Candidatus Nanohalobium constans]|uniref:Endonuclease III n=1 Tax=Candidatus Nanohalobium constans TaxID=2565781 RepID=A0A5Q0UH08_9ARCH|nr:endonuclease III [Candidatus Nanohalobium constans]QGA80235.1 endonuclease III [Candidatus Nanohalobium constans]
MQIDNSEERIRNIHQDLLEVYGEQDWHDDKDGVRQLLVTILSQNVADENTARAAENLFKDFKNYEEIENASVDELADSINPAGLPQTKAQRIQRTLKALREHGDKEDYSVEFLGDMEDSDAQDWLEEIKGIGPKTASVLLNFHFDADVMPVDTHVERIAKRFRLIPFSASNGKAHELLNEAVPHDIKNSFHMLIIEHGKNNCSARNPTCEETKLKRYCSRYELVENGDLTPEEYPPEEME